ncbi:monovalent cation/H(+) antiporter subunit G [Pseudonocardia asaccharolytica]|uniref:Monovalent cation/H+ antiporter subunit G n=1 Tax=Pseudonocardia asaccharolytica DSM 44247 = NBRC 16224 TaxID=1123024 RepID=A0A511D3J6_9PSEU|nr:monovalent cation/H(+) antiporter subunit G [Pseudonocardia asaccharolytica]GEL19083.1 hypothetical protein PA7_29200 [Pseudonocardia asaccharolytica DSM 44247 = NBRC 16224]
MTVVENVLLAAGVLVTVASAVGALAMRSAYNRMHFLSPVSSLGGPLIGAAIAVANGWSLTTALVGFTVFLLALSGPVLEAATGRLAAQREGLIPPESPE